MVGWLNVDDSNTFTSNLQLQPQGENTQLAGEEHSLRSPLRSSEPESWMCLNTINQPAFRIQLDWDKMCLHARHARMCARWWLIAGRRKLECFELDSSWGGGSVMTQHGVTSCQVNNHQHEHHFNPCWSMTSENVTLIFDDTKWALGRLTVAPTSLSSCT